MTERWKSIAGYEGLYTVSTYGRVRSTARSGTRGGVLGVNVADDGYTRVSLSAKGVSKCLPVAALVLEAFVEPRPLGKECAHNNGNPQDNHVSNLRWATHTENLKDRYAHGTDLRGERNPNCRLTRAEVSEIKKATGTHREIANLFGLASHAHVGRIKRGGAWVV